MKYTAVRGGDTGRPGPSLAQNLWKGEVRAPESPGRDCLQAHLSLNQARRGGGRQCLSQAPGEAWAGLCDTGKGDGRGSGSGWGSNAHTHVCGGGLVLQGTMSCSRSTRGPSAWQGAPQKCLQRIHSIFATSCVFFLLFNCYSTWVTYGRRK